MGLLEVPKIQHERFAALRQLIAREIPCILWGKDALTFGHGVWSSWRSLDFRTSTARPALFDQQVLVPDELLDAAATVLEEGEYKRTSELDRDYVKLFGLDEGEYALPKSVRLRHADVQEDELEPHTTFPTPRHILLLPQSYYSLDTRSASRFQSLVPPLDSSNADILVPKYNTFLEGLVHFLMHPPTSRWNAEYFHFTLIADLVRLRRKGMSNFKRDILSEIQTEDCTWYMEGRLYSLYFPHLRESDIEEYKRHKELRESTLHFAPCNGLPPDSLQTRQCDTDRLAALRQLIEHDIPCILWGEDALLAHSVSISLFDQQILVPDELLDRAADILETGKYKRTPEPQSHRNYFERFGPNRGNYAFPKSIRLQHVDIPDSDDPDKLWPIPQHILLLPQSYYGLNTRSLYRFQSLVPPLDSSNAGILLPKFNTFLEGLVHFLMHPPSGRPSQDSARFHSIFIHYLTVYRSKVVPDVKQDIMSQIQTEDCTWYMNNKLSRRQGVRSHEIEEYKRQKDLRRSGLNVRDDIVNSHAPSRHGANKMHQTIREYSTLRSLDKHTNYPSAFLRMHAPYSQLTSPASHSIRFYSNPHISSRPPAIQVESLSHVGRHLVRRIRL